jgi:tRNA U34 5-carboxymethylaminomethyl modifying enzyme MnmG/GidA
MSTLDEEKSEQHSKGERVRQAAYTLGISERTVYRRLRSGKLEQLSLESLSFDTVMSSVNAAKIETLIQDQISSRIDSLMRQNDMTNDKMTILCRELANRDAQILSLLENQQELTLTIQKLQAQIFELARLALLHPVHEQVKPQEKPLAVTQSPEPKFRGIRGWLRSLGNRNRSR